MIEQRLKRFQTKLSNVYTRKNENNNIFKYTIHDFELKRINIF